MKNYRIIFFFISCFCSVQNSFGQNYSFQKNIHEDFKVDLSKQMPDEGFLFVTNQSLENSFKLIRTNKSGALIWANEYSSPDYRVQILNIFFDNTDILLSGRIIQRDSFDENQHSYQLLLMKTDSLGNILFTKKYLPSDSSNLSIGYYIYFEAKEFNNEIYFAGIRESNSIYDSNPFNIKMNKNGVVSWAVTNKPPGYSWNGYTALAFLNGDIYCFGYYTEGTNSKNIISKFDTSGNLLWIKRYAVDSGYTFNIWAVENSRDGNIYVGGVYMFPFLGSYRWDPVIAKMDANGNFVWINYYHGDWAVAETFDIAVTDNSDVIQSLETEGFPLGSPAGAIRTNRIGKIKWAKIYNYKTSNFPRSLEINEDESILITGFTWGSPEGFIIKTDDNYETSCEDTLIQVETKHFTITSEDFTGNLVYGVIEDTFFILKTVLDSIPDTTFCIDTYVIIPPDTLLPPHPIDSCIYYSSTTTYPNPSDDFITIDFKSDCSGERKIFIYNDIGQLIAQDKLDLTNQYIFKKGILAAGIYLYSIEETESKKILAKGKLLLF